MWVLLSAGMNAGISIKVKGLIHGASAIQGDTLQWTITGISSGATVTNQLWIDLDSNGVINPSTDLLFVSFSETDGIAGSGKGGPSDGDGIANGVINTVLTGMSFPAGHYIFKTGTGADTASATFTITAMASPTYSISGKVTKSGSGVQNIVVSAETKSGQYFGSTDGTGNYTVVTNLASGSVVKVKVPTTADGFNSSIGGYVPSPSDTVTLTANVTGVNFVLTAGKFITGTVTNSDGNPVANLYVSAEYSNGSSSDGSTDATGKYVLAVDTGKYRIKFGSDNVVTGYLITYYNQKHVDMYSDTVVVTASTDTVKNINAVLYKGGIIMGTMKNGISSMAGGIAAFAYNAAGPQLYQSWHNTEDTYYYLIVLPGTYTLVFTPSGYGSMVVYYSQTTVYPGTAVTVGAVGDTVKNINMDFGGAITGIAQTTSSPTPKKFALNQNYPNPFNPSTMITYSVPGVGTQYMVSLKVFDLLGREVATLVNEVKAAGSYTATFNAANLPSGVYFYSLHAGNFVATQKLILLK
jgi:hypothetical protein